MELTEKQYKLISECFPKPRGKHNISNLTVLNAVIYVAENGCKWRSLPERFGNWHTVYMRLNRWSKSGVLAMAFEQLQARQIIRIRIEVVLPNGNGVKLKPNGNGSYNNVVSDLSYDPVADEQLKFIWLPQVGIRR